MMKLQENYVLNKGTLVQNKRMGSKFGKRPENGGLDA